MALDLAPRPTRARGWVRGALPCVLAVLLVVAFAALAHCLAPRPRASPPVADRCGIRRASARAASMLSTPVGAAGAARPTYRIRMVHHGTATDIFWRDVHLGANDARVMLGGIELQLMPDLAAMPANIRATVGEADALIMSCPYRNTEPLYKVIDEAIRFVIASGTPVITFNTDTYHNVEVFQYVGSPNRIIGKKGAIAALRKYPQLHPEGEQTLGDDPNLTASCDARMEAMRRRCGAAGSRKVGLVIGVLQERFNVTLDWRIEEFHREWGVQTTPFPPPTLLKVYSGREAQAAIDSMRVNHAEETCIVVPTGVTALKECVQLKRDNPAIFMCEVGDTGARVSAIATELDIPFVGQMQYQQGFSTVTNMYNLLVNYDRGSTWGRERGNLALTIDATYECIENCALKGNDVVVRRQERRANATPWVQVGVAMHLQGLDIARWDEYRKKKGGKSRRVLLPDGAEDTVVVIDGARNYGAMYAEDYAAATPAAPGLVAPAAPVASVAPVASLGPAPPPSPSSAPSPSPAPAPAPASEASTRGNAPPGRLYNGMLGEWIKYYPLYERVVDRKRNRGQYFIIHERDTRLPLGDVDRVTNGAFVRTQYGAIFRILLYAQDSVVSLQSLLEATQR